jgi:hypothetical protein
MLAIVLPDGAILEVCDFRHYAKVHDGVSEMKHERNVRVLFDNRLRGRVHSLVDVDAADKRRSIVSRLLIADR